MTSELFGETYKRNFEPMVRALTRRGYSREIAEEVVQSGWVRGFEVMNQLQVDALLVPWVNRIVVNKLRDVFRSRQRTRQLEPEDTAAVPSAVNLAAIDAERILHLCDERQRLMFSRVYLEECDRLLVAHEMCASSRQALNSALARTRRMLRKKLAA
jgi:DNA-directed RNA polymerase specialized sigma24 family protein